MDEWMGAWYEGFCEMGGKREKKKWGGRKRGGVGLGRGEGKR